MSNIIDPTRIFEIQGQRYQLYTVTGVALVGLNQTVLAAVSGYKHRVMGFDFATRVGLASISLKTSTGGVQLYNNDINTVIGGIPFVKPVINTGYFETASGDALLLDVATNTVVLNIHYITYKG